MIEFTVAVKMADRITKMTEITVAKHKMTEFSSKMVEVTVAE
jgi:hypothetical protein